MVIEPSSVSGHSFDYVLYSLTICSGSKSLLSERSPQRKHHDIARIQANRRVPTVSDT